MKSGERNDLNVFDCSFDDIVSRYQRTRDGRSIVYLDAELSLGEVEQRLELLQHLDGHIMVLNWMDPFAVPLREEKALMQLILVRAELQVVITRWRSLVDQLERDFTPQRTSGGTTASHRDTCSLLELDVQLLDSLDVLYSLDITASEYVPGYECILNTSPASPWTELHWRKGHQ